jgi:hypothetical protein
LKFKALDPDSHQFPLCDSFFIHTRDTNYFYANLRDQNRK